MAEVGDVYLCEICDQKVGVLQAGQGILVCCETPMKKQNNK